MVGGVRGVGVGGGVDLGSSVPGALVITCPRAFVTGAVRRGSGLSKPLSRPVGVRFVAGPGKTGPISMEVLGAGSLVKEIVLRLVNPAAKSLVRTKRFVELSITRGLVGAPTITALPCRRNRLVEVGMIISTLRGGARRTPRSADSTFTARRTKNIGNVFIGFQRRPPCRTYKRKPGSGDSQLGSVPQRQCANAQSRSSKAAAAA